MQSVPIAVIGLGTVGSGVMRLLAEYREHLRQQTGVDFHVKWVVVRDVDKPRSAPLLDAKITSDVGVAVQDPQVQIAVETMGGVDEAYRTIVRMLEAGKHVVTANKAVLAERGRDLFQVAHDRRRAISFEASVGGGVPIVAILSQSLAPNRVFSLSGILNGTSNYILSAMHDENLSYQRALELAQEKGFAESDPTLDVDGSDAAQKLAILSRLAFHSSVEWRRISRKGVDDLAPCDVRYASELGYVVKLLACARAGADGLRLRVGPTLVPKNRPTAQVRGEYNAVQVVGDFVGDTMFVGRGAGSHPTAASVVSGLVDLAVGRGQKTFEAAKLWEENPPGPAPIYDGAWTSRFYLRYAIVDRPGALAQIAQVLGKYGNSIASVIQHETPENGGGQAVPLIVMTHSADERAVRRALHESDALEIVREPTVCLHVAD